MSASPLSSYIATLEASGELSRILAPVDPVMEIAAITGRVCKQAGGGKALLFEKPVDGEFPLATNLFGSADRVCRALGIACLDDLTERLHKLLAGIPGLTPDSLDQQLAELPGFRRFAPSSSAEPDPLLLEMNPPDLTRFPFLQNWPDDGAATGHGRYITLPQVITTAPDGRTHNCGIYRVQLHGRREAAIQWKPGSGAARHAEQYHRISKRMPVAIVLGGDPALLFSAMFPLPGDLDEMTFAGFLRDAPLATTPCRSLPLAVPLGAEVIIEGYVEPGETVIEGPFGNHSGAYAPAAPAALMRVTAIRHRANAVIPATVVGPPPMEDCWMMLAWERLLLAFLRTLAPSVADIHFPAEWAFHQSAIISLEKPQPGMVRNIAEHLWTLRWFAAARIMVFVTAAPAPLTLAHAAWKTINVTDFTNDIFHDRHGGRVAIDATGSGLPRQAVRIPEDYTALVSRRWEEYGLA